MTSTSTNPSNEAAWLTSKQHHPFSVSSAPFPTPGPEDLVIQVCAVAVNPADAIVQTHGVILTEEQYPAILGCDVAGTIFALGSLVSTKYPKFQIGDRITAMANANPQYRGFQSYCAVPASLSSHIPSTTSFTDASVLPLCLSTAAVALFQADPGLALSLPAAPAPKSKHSTLLIWGGSSSVGCCAIQLAVAAGYDVLTTAGAHNAALCTTLGATYVFDHTRPDVVDAILTTLRDTSTMPFAGAMSAIMTEPVLRTCADIVSRVPNADARKHVATVLPGPAMPFPPIHRSPNQRPRPPNLGLLGPTGFRLGSAPLSASRARRGKRSALRSGGLRFDGQGRLGEETRRGVAGVDGKMKNGLDEVNLEGGGLEWTGRWM
nr:dehydrogenase orse [Quercus suber]